jgi:cAMP phosphodiesterase
MTEKEAKKEFDPSEMSKEKLTLKMIKTSKLEVKSVVHYPKENKYVQIKSFDEATKAYSCRVMGIDTDNLGSSEELVVNLIEQDLSKWIVVKLKTIKNVDYDNQKGD